MQGCDHKQLVRFPDSSDPNYKLVVGELVDLIGQCFLKLMGFLDLSNEFIPNCRLNPTFNPCDEPGRRKTWYFFSPLILLEPTLLLTFPVVKKCLDSLAFPDMYQRWNNIKPALKDTCTWIYENDTFQNWQTSKGLLWIKGSPGSGKSTLVKTVARKLGEDTRSLPELIVSFCFYGGGTELQRSILSLFRAVLHQLLDAVPESMGPLLRAFKKKQDSDTWEMVQLIEILEKCLADVLKERNVLLFVDALGRMRRGSRMAANQGPPTNLEVSEIAIIETWNLLQLSTVPKLQS